MARNDTDWSSADQQAGYSLPAHYFYDQVVFEKEKANIFLKSWHLVAHANELRDSGAFVTFEIFDQSVLVIRGRDGELRAFHNVCQHRGNRLVQGRSGKAQLLTCAYHAWTYASDGSLKGAPHTERLSGFDKSKHGLKPVAVNVFAAFVYVNLDPMAQPIAALAPGAEAQIRRYIPDLDHLLPIEVSDVPVPANWKVIQENSIEGYHFEFSGPAHAQLVDLIDFAQYTLSPNGDWWTYIGPPKPGATHAYGLPLQGASWQTDSFFNFGLWPNTTLYVFPYADVVGTFIMIPTGPETSILRFGYYGAEGREIPELTQACMRWMNEVLGPEDIRLNESTQKGLHSMGFERGRYLIGNDNDCRGEHLVRHFHQLCYSAIHA
ncbi:MAG: aromatic ring-hydroxylating dioxygenase subunit alpha [Steroidobacterales bacterium]